MPGTNLHTSILPMYDFVLYFLICCPRRGQYELASEDRNQGRGHSSMPSNFPLFVGRVVDPRNKKELGSRNKNTVGQFPTIATQPMPQSDTRPVTQGETQPAFQGVTQPSNRPLNQQVNQPINRPTVRPMIHHMTGQAQDKTNSNK